MGDYFLELITTITTISWIVLIFPMFHNNIFLFASGLLLVLLCLMFITSYFEHNEKKLYLKSHSSGKMALSKYQKIKIIIAISAIIAPIIFSFLIYIGAFNFIIYGDSGVIVHYGDISYSGGTQGSWKIQINDWQKSLEDVQLRVTFQDSMIVHEYNPIPRAINNYTLKDEYGRAVLICEWDNLPKGGVITVNVELDYVDHDSDLCPIVELSAKNYGMIYTNYCN